MISIDKIIQENNYHFFFNLDKQTVMTNAINYLKKCIFYGSYEIAEHIVSLTRLRNIPFNYLMRMSVAMNKPKFFLLFVDNGANFRYLDDHALKIACCNGYYQMVNMLILMGADPTCNNNYCVIVAASNGYNEIIKLLVEKGADVTANNNKAIHWAQTNGHLTSVELLKDMGASLDILQNLPITKYVQTIESNESTFCISRKSFDLNDNLISEARFIYEN
jgi:ankyrin repeat protein